MMRWITLRKIINPHLQVLKINTNTWEKYSTTWSWHFATLFRQGYQSMYFWSLATTVYCTRQSAFLLTLILLSESAYGSQLLIAKLLQVQKFDWNETNMYSSSFVWRFKIYLPNCLKILLSNVFLILILQKIKNETFHPTRGRSRLPAFEKW